jgi:hypothetical protein
LIPSPSCRLPCRQSLTPPAFLEGGSEECSTSLLFGPSSGTGRALQHVCKADGGNDTHLQHGTKPLQRSLHATACKREPTVADEYTRSGDTPYRSSIEHLCTSDSIWNFQKQLHQEKPHVVVQATTPDTEGRRRHPASIPHAKTSAPLRLGEQCYEADCKSAPAATHSTASKSKTAKSKTSPIFNSRFLLAILFFTAALRRVALFSDGQPPNFSQWYHAELYSSLLSHTAPC